ncbi:hypothetical protein ABNQ39_13210 [Azospirillum sp. A26]|uniref:hypothetical protein n=1 Tax=Azospirillum sp. A26 TaxID=3160607 RepID=UPI00366C9099
MLSKTWLYAADEMVKRFRYLIDYGVFDYLVFDMEAGSRNISMSGCISRSKAMPGQLEVTFMAIDDMTNGVGSAAAITTEDGFNIIKEQLDFKDSSARYDWEAFLAICGVAGCKKPAIIRSVSKSASKMEQPVISSGRQ